MVTLGSTISRSTEAVSRCVRLDKSGPICPPFSRTVWHVAQLACVPKKRAWPRFQSAPARSGLGPAGGGAGSTRGAHAGYSHVSGNGRSVGSSAVCSETCSTVIPAPVFSDIVTPTGPFLVSQTTLTLCPEADADAPFDRAFNSMAVGPSHRRLTEGSATRTVVDK